MEMVIPDLFGFDALPVGTQIQQNFPKKHKLEGSTQILQGRWTLKVPRPIPLNQLRHRDIHEPKSVGHSKLDLNVADPICCIQVCWMMYIGYFQDVRMSSSIA